jgi:hypothetical protein
VTPALARMARRAALPIKVSVKPWQIADRIIDRTRFEFVMGRVGDPKTVTFADDADAAVRAYLALCESLETTGTTSPVEPAAGCSASCSPNGVA